MSGNFPSQACRYCPPPPGPVLKLHAAGCSDSNEEWAVHFQPSACRLPFPGICCPLMALRCHQQLFTLSPLLPHSAHSFTQPGPRQSPSVPRQLSPGDRKVWVTSQAFPKPIENLGFSVHSLLSPVTPLLASLCGHWSTEPQKRPEKSNHPPRDSQTKKGASSVPPVNSIFSSMPSPPDSLS